MGDFEFKAEGNANTVTYQFEKFQNMVNSWKGLPPHKTTSLSPLRTNQPFDAPNKKHRALPSLEQIFENDPHSSILLCRTPPAGKDPEAQLVLLLLFGYRELRGVNEVAVVTLKHAVKRCLHPVLRLDRVLNLYTRERFVIKIGRGKGGKYRLTPLGIRKASAIADELLLEWNRA